MSKSKTSRLRNLYLVPNPGKNFTKGNVVTHNTKPSPPGPMEDKNRPTCTRVKSESNIRLLPPLLPPKTGYKIIYILF